VLGVSEIQTRLPDEQTTLLSYFVLDNETLAFLITKDDFQTVELEVGREELSQVIRNFRDFASIDEAHPEAAVKLYHWLIEPLKEHLDTPHLAIVPHNVMHYFPFAALTDGEHYLIDDYTLTTLPSASVLPFIQNNAARTRLSQQPSVLVLGDPAADVETLSLLVWAKQEAQTIADLYQTEPLLDQAGTEQAVRQQVGQAEILHLATHGEYNQANALYSTLYLAPDEAGEDSQSDGRLEVHEVYGLDLGKNNLVVLSACETQVGALSAGDEVVGLTRAFIFAGTPSVIASLWQVDDQASALLMERFYTHLRSGVSKAEALRQAQRETREAYPNPYFWSAFVLSGDGG
jgi:CHAT domain-containing protein